MTPAQYRDALTRQGAGPGSSPSPDTSPPSGLPRADLSRAVDGGDVLPQKSPVQRQDVAAKSRRRRKSYSGELAQPIQVPVPSVLELLYPNALPEEREACFLQEERAWKMLALLAHFDVEQKPGANPWYELALREAQELGIPGLRVGGRGRGRSRAFGEAEFNETEAVIDTLQLRKQPKFLRLALAELQRRSPGRYAQFSFEVFRTSYYAMRERSRSRK